MVWDLRGALLKKEERESSRLVDFEFKLRARTFRLLAEALNIDPVATVAMIAEFADEASLQALAHRHGFSLSSLREAYVRCHDDARSQLVQEIGDPTPYRLA